MAKRKIRRSYQEHYRKMVFVWIATLFFLLLLILLDFIVVYNQINPPNKALSAELDYSKVSFNGMTIGSDISTEALAHQVIDAEFDYSYDDISISVDENNKIDRLAFYTTATSDGDGTTIDDVALEYRGYPLKAASDFVSYFGYTKITNFSHYKYLSYGDDNYGLDLTLMDGNVYNVVLYKKSPILQ
ncbi:hypothetical protein IKF25_01745 [Candidatus Saccharibacteria bacterium]|nr:hypothetical protein [Candidatus Saccharibacteria bacterium]